MIARGYVNRKREALLPITIHGHGQQTLDVEAIIDTGYNGSITIPQAIFQTLNLQPRSRGNAMLADGSVRRFETYFVDVDCGGVTLHVSASAIGQEVLIGMKFLRGCELHMKIEPQGFVEVHG